MRSSLVKRIEVVAAIVQYGGNTLCVQRGPSKLDYIHEKIEFSGGKIEAGELGGQAIKRELREELQLNVDQADYFITVQHSYSDFYINLHAYLCPIDHRGIVLNEHVDASWLAIEELSSLGGAAADIPIVDKLIGIK